MKENYESIYKKMCEKYGDKPLVFIKFFEKIEYAQDFLSGNYTVIHLNIIKNWKIKQI